MATAPFGAVLEAALKEDVQGGRFTASLGITVDPKFFCCVSGTSVGVAKDPVALMIVDPTRMCTGTPVTVDYSNSWSPSSTIASWEVDWGDGNTSSGAWPGAGTVNHPLGGYVLPGTYTITLTVTDLLGEIGTQEVTVVALDCDAIGVDIFAGCEASGVWFSSNGGTSWAQAGLNSVRIYDAKAEWSMIGLDRDVQRLWAATENGLYKTVDGGTSWQHITLTQTEYGTSPVAAAVRPSKIFDDTVYVLAHEQPAGRVWLYKTEDGGETWTWTEVSITSAREVDDTVNGYGPKFTLRNARLHALSYSGGIYVRQSPTPPSAPVWDTINMGTITASYQLTYHNNKLWVTQTAPNDFISYWDGVNWHELPAENDGLAIYTDSTGALILWANEDLWDADCGSGCFVGVKRYSAAPSSSHEPKCSIGGDQTTDANHVVWYDVDEDAVCASNWHPTFGRYGVTVGRPYDVALNPCYVYTGYYQAATWSYGVMSSSFCKWNGELLACPVGNTHLACREDYLGVSNYRWVNWGTAMPGGETVACARVVAGNLYVATGTTATPARLYRLTAGLTWTLIGEWHHRGQVMDFVNFGGYWFAAIKHTGTPGNDDGIYRLGYQMSDTAPPDDGRAHILDVSIDEQYVYVGLVENATGDPVMARVTSDLAFTERIYAPAAGSWVGVLCDWWDARWVWIYGDNGLLRSTIYGESFTDITPGGWAGELIRPLLTSLHDPDDFIAILNTSLESWQSRDSCVTWTKTGDTAFACHTTERDFIDPQSLLIGRVNAGGNHLQYSPNNGTNWLERSAGITANAPISAIQVTA